MQSNTLEHKWPKERTLKYLDAQIVSLKCEIEAQEEAISMHQMQLNILKDHLDACEKEKTKINKES